MKTFYNILSFNKLKELLKLGSVNTVISYIEYLEASWLLLVITRYAYSVKKQQIANKKIYCIDTGFPKSVAFSFSEERGKFLENTVFLHLRRFSNENIYYYKTNKDKEVDFYLPKSKTFIQVCQSLHDPAARERETSALCEAMAEAGGSTAYIVTEDEKDSFSVGKKKIKVIPIYEWLLSKKP